MTRYPATLDRPAERAPSAAPAPAEHLHFDRRARVWLTHAELLGRGAATARAREQSLDGGAE